MAISQYPIADSRLADRAWVRASSGFAAIVVALFCSAAAAAQDYPVREVGHWTIAASTNDTGCFLSRSYDRPGDTMLLLGVDRDGTNHLSVLNANWSIKPKDQLALNFRLSSGGYADHAAVGMVSDEKPGFVTSFEAKFPDYFAASKVLNISRGETPVEKLSLEGSGAAVAELRHCVDIRRAAAPVRAARKRADQIPTDPFAPAPTRKAKR